MAATIMVVRIYLHEGDKGGHESLMQEILQILRKQGSVKGVTVFRGIAGFDETGEVASADVIHILANLPLVIEFFGTPAHAEAAIQALKGLTRTGHIVSWEASQH